MTYATHREDRDLARRILTGDEEAFTELFDSVFHGLFRFVLSRVRDETLAEEIVQKALCKAFDKIQTYRGEAALFTWLCTFCRFEISATMRTRGRQPESPLILDRPEVRAALESIAEAETGPVERLEREELGRIVRLTLDHLPGHYGDALEWKYIEGVSVREIAGRLGVTSKAAESLLTRARNAFRDAFRGIAEGWEPVTDWR
ncbi:MAG: sigma-70 family RNA polymerase sigma factor [Thermoanaerobaculia bacterium]|nr:sigma-70 family RNA polymerase sigma factor [Thermoanaerobaculia bacterium]